MLIAVQFLAVFSCALFAGAAVYINLIEHPARMCCATRTAATVWAPSYQRATYMQAALAIVAFCSGVAVWWLTGVFGWMLGAVCIGAVVPFTFIVIMPTNHRLLEAGRDLSSAETRTLLERWGRLHAVRSALSLIAAAVFIILLL